MIKTERIRLNREDFVRWLGPALSGDILKPEKSSFGAEKSSDVFLIFDGNRLGAAPIICVLQAQMLDLYAFLATYTKVSPFSAFFRILPLERISVVEQPQGVSPSGAIIAKCVAGAAMAEAWVASARESERSNNVLPMLLASLSSSLGQAALAQYDEATLNWVLDEWVELHKRQDDLFRNQDVEGASRAWKVMRSAILSHSDRSSQDRREIVEFLSLAIAHGSIRPEMLSRLTALSRGVDLIALIAASREERINRFNEVMEDLRSRSDRGMCSEFIGGLMLAIAGNGSFEFLRSAREFDGWLNGAVTWFGICAALFEESNVLTYGNSAGRRIVRDILRRDAPFAAPTADINSSEYKFFAPGEAFELPAHASNSLNVELLPNVISRVTIAAPPYDDRRRDEVEMLVRSLDEAGYLIDRARRLAHGSANGDRQGTLYKQSRKGRLR
ncbi:hypothetical protein [Gluconobacter sp. P5B12]|uniref:hypothetical protein n=1 Tax=unclassified Gluconobacter TaxID=2644261 RepID=UPI001C050DD1|nr:hypothetical protein [Gluconobacter sp. P5B12]